MPFRTFLRLPLDLEAQLFAGRLHYPLGLLARTPVVVAGDGSGLELVKQQDFDLVFLDLKMPEMDGAELFRQIKTIKPKLPVTIITGYPDSDMMARALAQGPFGIMSKPFGESDIVAAVANFLRVTGGR